MLKVGILKIEEEEEVIDLPPVDFRAIIAVDSRGGVHFMDYTLSADSRGILEMIDYDANELSILGDVEKIGLYHIELTPWSDRSYDGDYDCGVDAELISKIYTLEDNMLDTLKE